MSAMVLLYALLVAAQSVSPNYVLGAIDVRPTGRVTPPEVIVASAPSVPVRRPETIRELGPEITAVSAIVVDRRSGKVLLGKQPYAIRSLASITKLATALALVRTDWSGGIAIEVRVEDLPVEGNTIFRAGDRVRSGELLTAMLVRSDNGAARALARTFGVDRTALQVVPRSLGLPLLRVMDPTGLHPGNRGTAVDAARLLDAAMASEDLRERMRTNRASLTIDGPSPRVQTIWSTNRLLSTPPQDTRVHGGKTGYLEEAGYNLVTLVEREGNEVIVAVLGAATHDDRFRDAELLATWVFERYAWISSTSSPLPDTSGSPR